MKSVREMRLVDLIIISLAVVILCLLPGCAGLSVQADMEGSATGHVEYEGE